MRIFRCVNRKEIGELLWDRRSGFTYEMHLDVHSSYHRQGIGRSMVEELEEIVIQEKGKAIISQSAKDNELAEKFFLGVGFVKYLIKDYYGFGGDANLWVKPINRAREI